MIPISLLIISVLIILNVYQFINSRGDDYSQKELRNHLNQLIETSDFVEAFILNIKFPDNLFISGNPAKIHKQRIREEVALRKLPKFFKKINIK